MTNKWNKVLYTGITNDLKRRVFEHREKLVEGFTGRYNITKLVYYEILEDAKAPLSARNKIKAGSRAKKIELINGMNANWSDLYEAL